MIWGTNSNIITTIDFSPKLHCHFQQNIILCQKTSNGCTNKLIDNFQNVLNIRLFIVTYNWYCITFLDLETKNQPSCLNASIFINDKKSSKMKRNI